MNVHSTACPLDCPDACSLDVTVSDGRVTKVDGNHRNPVTAGFICAKVRSFPDHMYGEERLSRPLIRKGGKPDGLLEPVTWDAALDLIAAKIEEIIQSDGGEAILPFSYGGCNGPLTQDNIDSRLFHRLGASRLQKTICATPTAVAAGGLYGEMPGVAIPDYACSKLIVIWGSNPSATGIHLVPYIREAMRKGAKLVVVDPRRTKLAAQADLHIALRPGTDLPVALSLINWLFDSDEVDADFLARHARGVSDLRNRSADWSFRKAAECSGVEASLLAEFARLFASSSPAVIRCGWGLERNRNGGSAVAAVLALPAVGGKFGVRGGGFTMSNSSVWKLNESAAVREAEPGTRLINMNLLGRELIERKDPPIKMLFVYNSNVLATNPNQEMVRKGLSRPDLFTVVYDQVMTDTTAYADVVLPATTFLEHDELVKGYGAYAMQDATPAVAPFGEARPNLEVFGALSLKLRLHKPGDPMSAAELRAAVLSGEAAFHREKLDAGMISLPEFGDAPIQFEDVFPRTPDRKVHLCPVELDEQAPAGLYGYRPDPATEEFPLALISPATEKTVSSTFGQLVKKIASIHIHPDDAGPRKIGDGESVRVWNSYGEVRCKARVTDSVRPGVTQLAKGLWRHNFETRSTGNALMPDTLADLGGGACFNDSRVQVEPCS
jgi:anaerobic selenocysteine-containing dehydrogenase